MSFSQINLFFKNPLIIPKFEKVEHLLYKAQSKRITISMSKQQKIITYKQLKFGILYDAASIRQTVKLMAEKINSHYRQLLKHEENPSVVVICVLKGAFMFFTDLIRYLEFRVEQDFIRLSSYHGGMVSTHEVKFMSEVDYDKYKGKHLLVVEDIVDTGKTLFELVKKISTSEPKSIEIAALVRRPDKQQAIECKWVGLDCSDFIIGYGLDLDEQFRNLPEIYQKI